MVIVKYPQYVEHERQRVQTNDTVMGLLAGSKLASQVLRLTEGSELVLSQIFPRVEHINRFNLRTGKARAVLDDAEHLLGILAVPQVIALHEDLLRGMLYLIADVNPSIEPVADEAKAATVHQSLEGAASFSFNQNSVELFHLIRVARNTLIHSGGRADRRLVNRLGRTSPQSLIVWQTITRETFPQYVEGDLVALGLTELIGILAVAKRLAEEANVALQRALPAAKWADIIVADWKTHARPGNPQQRLRQVAGLARRNYAALALTVPDLEAAMRRAGAI
jgi:hypothetical protein